MAAEEDEATARRRPWHSVYIVLGQELPFDLVFEDLRPQVLQTCLDVLGRSFLRSWPGGPQEMEDSLRRGVEESGSGPVAHGLRRSQAQELAGRLAPFVATQVSVNRAAAEAAAREISQMAARGPLIGAPRIPPPDVGVRPETFEWDEEIEVASPVQASPSSELQEGCVVRIEEDLARAQELQGSHWAESMKHSLGEVGTVVNLKANGMAEVVCPSVSHRSQTWNVKSLKIDPSEALFCLDLHDHPLLWCGSFPNCHTCDAECDRRKIWEAYRCAKCDFDVCSECSKSYQTGSLRSRHHLEPLGTVQLPRGLRSSRRSCVGELLPGGCRCTDTTSAMTGASCAFGKFFICDACRNFEELGEITAETRLQDLENLQNSTQRIAASLRLHPSEIFCLAENGIFTKLAELLGQSPAVRCLVLDLGEWLATEALQEVPPGPIIVEISSGVWTESYVLGEKSQAADATECWVATNEGCKDGSQMLRVPLDRIRAAFVTKERGKSRRDPKLRAELEEEIKKGSDASESTVRKFLDQGADVLSEGTAGADSQADGAASDGLVVKALRNGCKAAVLEALLQSGSPVMPKDLKAVWKPNGEGVPLYGEPRLAMLLAERGSPWAELCSEACAEMAKDAELHLSSAELRLPELEASIAQTRQKRVEEAERRAAEAAEAARIEEEARLKEEAKEEKPSEAAAGEDSGQAPAGEAGEAAASQPEAPRPKEEKKGKEDAKAAGKAEEEEALQRRREDREIAKAKLAIVDAKSRIVEAKVAAAACQRRARSWPQGNWPSLMEEFQKALFAPILEADAGPKAGGLELNGRFGSWLGGLLRAGCKPTERQVEIVARRVSLALAEAAGPVLKDAMAFVERVLEPSSRAGTSVAGLVTALKRHGVEARLQRLSEVGAVASDSGMAVVRLRERAQRLTQLENWKAAELAENPAVADLVGRLSEPGVLDDIGALLRSQACTPYELSLQSFPSRLLPLLSSTCEWPWPAANFSGQTIEALVPALQWLLGLCETFPVAAADSPVSGVDCLVRPLELALESSAADTSKTLFVEPLLPLRDLERFLLQTTEMEEEYLGWCRNVVGKNVAERNVTSQGSKDKEAWRIAEVKSFEVIAKLPVHSLIYEDGEEAKLLLHLREVVVLGEAEKDESGINGTAEETTEDQAPEAAPSADGMEDAATSGPEGEMEVEAEGQAVSQEDAEVADESIHKLVVKMPMVQAGEIPFEMVWADLLEAGEAVLQASPDGTWTALGWKDRSELQEAFKASLEANGQGTLARGMTREQANLLLERMDELADAMSVVVDRTDVPDAPRPKKSTEGPICRRVQLQNSSRTVGVAVWEYDEGLLDVVDQSGRFLPKVPSSQILPPSNRRRHAPGRSLPLELSVLGLSGGSSSRGEARGFEWQFAGDQGWCKYDAAASRLLEAAHERGEETVSVRSGSNRYLVNIRAGTQTNMTLPGHRVRRVRRLAIGGAVVRNGPGAFLALERNFSAVDRGPVNDFEQKVLERKLGEEHFRPDEDGVLPSEEVAVKELANGVPAPRLHVEFFRVAGEVLGDPLPLECTVLQALLWNEPAGAASATGSVDQRLRYVLRVETTPKPLSQEPAPSSLRRDHTGVQAAGRAGAEGESATLLALLRRLRRLTSSSIRWENDQLNRKLAHQLAQPLLTASGVVPSWVKALPLTYPFLFERKLKEQLLHCMGFGTSHAVLWLQKRCVEARFGEQLRLARERVARTGNDAELWELHEQAAADESVFVGAGRSEMARLPGRGSCNLLETAERVIQLTYNSRALLEVVFDDETGFGDGVTQSFYTDVAAELCCDNEGASLWAEHLPQSRMEHQGKSYLHSRRGLFPRPHVPGSPNSLAACKRFRFLGRLMAKALRDGFIVPVALCPHFFEAVLGADLPLEALPSPGDGWAGEFLGACARFARDRRRGDAGGEEPGWAAKYLQAKGAAGEMSFEEYSQHCFFLETGSSGMEICEGGAERPLTTSNLDDFVECAAQWWLRDGIIAQVEAFRLGVEDVCDSPAIWAFEAEELQELMCGASAPKWTEKDLKQHLKFRGGYNTGSPMLLIEELVRMTPERKSQFLEFVTACPRLPHGGLAAAEIAVVPAQPKGSLPRAHTCTNELQLPSYDSLEELSAKLYEAMENARGMYE